MVSAVESGNFVHAHATDIGSDPELTTQIIAPLVIGAANHQSRFAGLGHQLHAAVTAHVVKHMRVAMLVAHHE